MRHHESEPVYLVPESGEVYDGITSLTAGKSVFPASRYKDGVIAILTADEGEELILEAGETDVGGCSAEIEDGKVAVRNIRRKTKETIAKSVKDGDMGEDEGDRLLKDLDKVTKSVTDEIDALLETKQKEIMEV